MKKVLVLGSSGAMGRYIVPILAQMGYQVDAVALDDQVSEYPNVRCIKGNALVGGISGGVAAESL